MKALRNFKDGLAVVDAEEPNPGQKEVLIKVHATAITAAELAWPETTARENPIPGHDVAGTVAKVGSEVTAFKEGDEVFALTSFSREGCAAEYAIANTAELAKKPQSLTFEEAASIPLAALTAWQAIFLHSDRKRSALMKILITGAGGTGGVGVLVTQVARFAGLRISATCSADKRDLVRSLGASEVFDYRQTALENLSHDFDIVIDCVGGETLKRCFAVVGRGGTLISLSREPTDDEKSQRPDVRAIFFIVEPDGDELAEIAELCNRGQIKTVIHAVYPVEKGAEAFEVLNEGHAKGKIVLKVAGST